MAATTNKPETGTEAARRVYEKNINLDVAEARNQIEEQYGFRDVSDAVLKKARQRARKARKESAGPSQSDQAAADRVDTPSTTAPSANNGTVGSLIELLRTQLIDLDAEAVPHAELLSLLPAVTGSLEKKRDFFRQQSDSIREEVSGLRDILGGGEEEEDESPPPRRLGRPKKGKGNGDNRGGNRGRNPDTMVNYCRRAYQKAKAKGLSKRECARALLEMGWKTPADEESFAKSVYVSGINKMPDLEHFRVPGEREGRYRLKEFSPKKRG